MELTVEQIKLKKKEIREGNDLLRRTFFSVLGNVCCTQGVVFHPRKAEILTLVREFSNFEGSNDPYEEHDFGQVELESDKGNYCETRKKKYEKFFFKIDYYDMGFRFGVDPFTEPFKRVLTIMKASEY